MFGRTVTVDGKEFFVCCTPETPLWDVLLMAAKMAKQDDEAARRARPYLAAFDGLRKA